MLCDALVLVQLHWTRSSSQHLLDLRIDEPQLIQLVTILAIKPNNLPSILCSKLLAVVGGCSRVGRIPGAGRGQQVEVASVVVVFTLTQFGLGPVFITVQSEFVFSTAAAAVGVVFARSQR